MAVLEIIDKKSLAERRDDEYMRKASIAQARLEQYYMQRQKQGRGETFGDKLQRQENLELLEEAEINQLQQLQTEIESLLAELGMSFDPETGAVTLGNASHEEKQRPREEITTELDDIQGKTKATAEEYEDVTRMLYGEDEKAKDTQGNEIEDDKKQERVPGPSRVSTGLVRENKQIKENLMRRDVLAKRILEERVKIEAVKDNMDMDAAMHVARKNRLMVQIEMIKLEMAKRVARGEDMNSDGMRANQTEINGIMNQISRMEDEFEVRRDAFMANFSAARVSLESLQRESENARQAPIAIEVEKASAGTFNNYRRSLTYSEDGVLNGAEIEGAKEGRTFSEREVYDESGVMVYGVADILSRSKSINIDGTVVTCVTEFTGSGGNFEDSYCLGDATKLVASSQNNDSSVEEKPDIDEERDNHPTNEDAEVVVYESMVREMVYHMMGVQYTPETLNQVPIEQRMIMGKGLELLGYDGATHQMNPVTLAKTVCATIAAQHLAMEAIEDTFGEIKPPPHN